MLRRRPLVVLAALLALVASLGLAGPGLAATAGADAPAPGDQGGVSPLVTGGVDAGPDAAPYMVGVIAEPATSEGFDQQLCGGTAITDRWILTASHCVVTTAGTPLAPHVFTVISGSTDLFGQGRSLRSVAEVVIHPAALGCGRLDDLLSFSCRAPHDVALLRITPPAVGLPTVGLARPHQTQLAGAGMAATVYGWGATDPDTTVFPDQLQSGAVAVHPSAFCAEQYPTIFDAATMRCASGLTGTGAAIDACSGDSGGPLVVVDHLGRARQVGVASFGNAGTCGGRPTVYATTLANHAWIASIAGLVSFPDLVGSPHADAIIAVAEAGITTGRADGTFGPNQPLTRGQIATFLARALELPPAEVSFPDVPATHPHRDGIGAIVAAGITTGRADGTFGPDAVLNRGQMASFLTRGLNLPPGATDFPDVPTDHPHHDSIGSLVTAGITTGRADGTYGPALAVTRGQLASFLARALGLPLG